MMVIRQFENGIVPNVIGLSRQMAGQRVAGSDLKPAFSWTDGRRRGSRARNDAGDGADAQAGTKVQGEGEVTMVLTRSGTDSGAGQPKPPTETTPDTLPPAIASRKTIEVSEAKSTVNFQGKSSENPQTNTRIRFTWEANDNAAAAALLLPEPPEHQSPHRRRQLANKVKGGLTVDGQHLQFESNILAKPMP